MTLYIAITVNNFLRYYENFLKKIAAFFTKMLKIKLSGHVVDISEDFVRKLRFCRITLTNMINGCFR